MKVDVENVCDLDAAEAKRKLFEDTKREISQVFSGYREDSLLYADVVLRPDGKPAFNYNSTSQQLEVQVYVSVNQKKWAEWEKNANRVFSTACSTSQRLYHRSLFGGVTNRVVNFPRNIPHLFVNNTLYLFNNEYGPVIDDMKRKFTGRVLPGNGYLSDNDQYIKRADSPQTHVELIDNKGNVIRWVLAWMPFPCRGMQYHHHNFFAPLFWGLHVVCARASDFDIDGFSMGEPQILNCSFGLTIDAARNVSNIVCSLGERSKLIVEDSIQMVSYHKSHPNRTVSVGSATLELAHLSPRLLMGTTLVTPKLWVEAGGQINGSYQPDLPICCTWHDCMWLINRLNSLPERQEDGLVFRMPTGKEWMDACLAGSATDLGVTLLEDGTEIDRHFVGHVDYYKRTPNACGLIGMIEMEMQEEPGQWMRGEPYWKRESTAWVLVENPCRVYFHGLDRPCSLRGDYGHIRICAECAECDEKSCSPDTLIMSEWLSCRDSFLIMAERHGWPAMRTRQGHGGKALCDAWQKRNGNESKRKRGL